MGIRRRGPVQQRIAHDRCSENPNRQRSFGRGVLPRSSAAARGVHISSVISMGSVAGRSIAQGVTESNGSDMGSLLQCWEVNSVDSDVGKGNHPRGGIAPGRIVLGRALPKVQEHFREDWS